MIDLEAKRRRDREYCARKRATQVPRPRKQRGPKHTPEDYRDELEEMVCHGLTTKEFITRSDPSTTWFQRNVMPICTLSRCMCGKYFNPMQVGMLVECEKPRCTTVLRSQW